MEPDAFADAFYVTPDEAAIMGRLRIEYFYIKIDFSIQLLRNRHVLKGYS